MSDSSAVGQKREERDRASAGGMGQDALGRPVGHWEKTEFCSQGPAVPGIGLGSTPANHSPASWETHRLVWSNVLAADHHPSQCQEAVA